MNELEYLEKLKSDENMLFEDLMNVIKNTYIVKSSSFKNGEINNSNDENQGSAKLLSFAIIHKLDKQQTLKCFGQYYKDVLANPAGDDHANIRNFMNTSWSGVEFANDVLIKVTSE